MKTEIQKKSLVIALIILTISALALLGCSGGISDTAMSSQNTSAPTATSTNSPTDTTTATSTPTSSISETETPSPIETSAASETPSQTPTDTPNETPTFTPTETPQTGRMIISTTPVNGDIYLNGQPIGNGRVDLPLPAGNYTVSFGEIDGYIEPNQESFTLVVGETFTKVYTYLEPPPPPPVPTE